MKWNNQNKQPVEGTYKHRNYDKDELKSYVNEHFPYRYFPIIHSALESVNWNLEDFFLKKANKDIHGEAFCISILCDLKKDLKDYWADLANGHWSVENDETDIYRRFFFCETEEDVWDVFRDLPFEVANNLMECYYGYSTIPDVPVCLKKHQKALEMRNYLYGESELGNDEVLYLGSKIEVVDGKKNTGTIVGLTEDHIAVQIDSPLRSIISRYVRYGNYIDANDDNINRYVWYRDQLASKKGNRYVATEYAKELSSKMLIEISKEEEVFLSDIDRLKKILAEYAKMKDNYYPPFFYLKLNYCPNSLSDIEFDHDMMDRIEQYVKDNYL